MLRMDNGPKMVSQALQRFCDGKVELTYIPPGCPRDNGYIESFNNRLRRECEVWTSRKTTYESLNSQSQLRATYNARHAPRRPSA